MTNIVLEFWFSEASRPFWFQPTPAFDESVRMQLGALYEDAIEGRLDDWKSGAEDALGLCILFDQVPRNIFRKTRRAFESDPQARAVARHIVAQGFDRSYPTDDHRLFSYLPFQHSEDLDDQKLAVRLMSERTADQNSLEYARRHLEIIARFGRFPHRNVVLGRTSTKEESAFLRTPRSSF